jgi:hypothetical protein
VLILRFGLYVSIGLAVLATWTSSSVGYPIEVAMVRGLLAFMAGGFVSYVAELVVMTAPPSARPHEHGARTEYADDDTDEYDERTEPVSLPAIRNERHTERDAALDDSRAA